ncbi:MAG: sigma factor [bacterium]
MQSKTDNELLNCYAATGDGTAFAELVSRYSPLVYRVCRRLLGNDHDAEDAELDSLSGVLRDAVISASVVLIGASVPISIAVARAGEDKPAPPTETRALPATPQPKPAQTNSLATLSLDELKKLLDEKQKALQAAYKTVEGPDVQKQRTKEAEAEKAFNGVLARTKSQANNPELEAATKTYNAALQTFSALYKEKFAAAGGPKLQEEILALQGELQRRQPPDEKPAGKPALGQGGPVGDYWGRQNGQ